MKKSIYAFIFSLFTMAGYADNKTFTVDSEEGITMKFQVVSEDEKTCMLGTEGGVVAAISTKESGSLTIPNKAQGYSVIALAKYALSGCSKLNSVSLPESLVTINKYAFANCSALTSIVIPNNVREIKEYSFTNCIALKTAIISENVTEIGEGAFAMCTSLTSINIPTKIDSIEPLTFSNCKNLESIDIPYGMVNIGASAFWGCEKLSSINISESVFCIGNYAFSGCTKLSSVIVPENTLTIGKGAFHGCSSLKTIILPSLLANMADELFSGCSSLESLEIPQSIISIGNSCFSGCSALKNIKIPSGIISISDNCFSGCSALKFIEFPKSIDNIGTGAFGNCSSLESITIPERLTKINVNTFSGCSALSSVILPEGLLNIDDYAFANCTDLCEIKFPESLLSIGKGAFSGCKSLQSITIPRKVKDILYDAFGGCSNLWTVYSKIQKPFSFSDAFWPRYDFLTLYVPYKKSSLYESLYPWNRIKKIEELEMEQEDNFTASVSGEVQNNMEFMITKLLPLEVQLGDDISPCLSDEIEGCVTIPEKVKESPTKTFSVVGIGESAFKNSNISSITLPHTIRYINEDAFKNCLKLESINIPYNVKTIGDVFVNCPSLKSVDVNACNPSDIIIGNKNFNDISDISTLYVPTGAREKYASHNVWGRFKIIIEKNGVAVGDISARYGAKVNLPIYMKNDEEIAGLQFKLTLPSGVSIPENEEGLISTLTDRTEGMTVLGLKDSEEDNSYLFVLLSLDGNSISGKDGAIINVPLNISSKMAKGNYETSIEEIQLATSTFETLTPADASSDLIIRDYVLGDVNGDGDVDVADAVCVVNHIVGKPTPTYVGAAADTNSDGVVDIADAVRIVNLIVGKIDALARKQDDIGYTLPDPE